MFDEKRCMGWLVLSEVKIDLLGLANAQDQIV